MLQALPLEVKIRKTQQRIREWIDTYGEDGVYISFSGGKDSTVLLHIARKMSEKIPAVFADTGLEYPAIRKFTSLYENVCRIKPEINFREVIIKYGYPVIGKEVAECVWTVRHSKGENYKKNRLERLMGTFKRKDGRLSQYNRPKYKFLLDAPFEISSYCCREMKKKPFNKYAKKTGRLPIMATMTEESKLREGKWLKNGCNSFKSEHPNSAPMSFWREQDVLQYLYIHHDEILEMIFSSLKEQGFTDEEIKDMDIQHPWASCYGKIKPYITKDEIDGQVLMQQVLNDYRECKFCTTGCKRTGCIFCLFGITQDLDRILKAQQEEPLITDYVLRGGEFNEKGMWQPSKNGLGFWFVLRWLTVHGGINIPFDNREEYESQYGDEKTKELLNT